LKSNLDGLEGFHFWIQQETATEVATVWLPAWLLKHGLHFDERITAQDNAAHEDYGAGYSFLPGLAATGVM